MIVLAHCQCLSRFLGCNAAKLDNVSEVVMVGHRSIAHSHVLILVGHVNKLKKKNISECDKNASTCN